MKLTVISHAYQDERYLSTLDAMSQLSGAEIALIHPLRYQGATCHWCRPHCVYSVPLPILFGSRQGAFLYQPRALTRTLNGLRPDVILHEQEVYSLGASQIAVAARERAIPLVQFVWENVDRRLALPRRLMRHWVLSCATSLIAGSERARCLHKQWGFRGQIDVIPQMSVAARAELRPGRRSGQTLRVCFVGRLVPCKGVDCLLRAIEALHRRGFPVHCTIAGHGPGHIWLQDLARTLGISSVIDFCGQLSADRVKSLLRSNDVLVLPSRRTPAWEEQFGLVLAEAMAEGTVAVGSRTGAIPEVIGTDDLLFAEDDAEELAGILQRLANDSDFYRRSRLHAWRRARERFDVHVVAEQKLAFLSSILDRQNACTSVPNPADRLLPEATR